MYNVYKHINGNSVFSDWSSKTERFFVLLLLLFTTLKKSLFSRSFVCAKIDRALSELMQHYILHRLQMTSEVSTFSQFLKKKKTPSKAWYCVVLYVPHEPLLYALGMHSTANQIPDPTKKYANSYQNTVAFIWITNHREASTVQWEYENHTIAPNIRAENPLFYIRVSVSVDVELQTAINTHAQTRK